MGIGAGKTLGFYSCKTACDAKIIKNSNYTDVTDGKVQSVQHRVLIMSHNIPQILGYIPIIGIFIGGVRISDIKKNKAYLNQGATKGAQVLCVTRGVCEILGLGILFLIPDLIASVVRLCKRNS